MTCNPLLFFLLPRQTPCSRATGDLAERRQVQKNKKFKKRDRCSRHQGYPVSNNTGYCHRAKSMLLHEPPFVCGKWRTKRYLSGTSVDRPPKHIFSLDRPPEGVSKLHARVSRSISSRAAAIGRGRIFKRAVTCYGRSLTISLGVSKH